ncbi:HigA family addiction module antitoxin [Aminobacter niigataensis]|uniref:HigA family addiction module antitoxin n=1 Tax=Aminobacter niigataensis TaxID=83265 RepID=UPI0024C53911|nr:HigA family addiction module antitoxin [Aminobacter niigataensis]CAI2931700.1 Addiction module antitoxin [Aminobacter niigataensis]
MAQKSLPAHPGSYVRENILNPRKVTVTEAAKLVGISRPGLSNFLNGKVSATSDMAARLERAFGVSAKTILDLQAAYDARAGKSEDAAQKARAYVPPFLNVQANEIVRWFTTTILARTKLSVLLRMLVHSTGHDLQKVDFPGNDDAERPGWDGFIEANSGTPWIPSGSSGWEFGVTADINGKADGDFAKSVRATKVRGNITFVFVTPRRWPGKAAWVAAMKAKKIWKDVRAYDVSDLEQWMEQSLAAQTWFANQTDRPSGGVRTLERCWDDWANVAAPVLHPSLFTTANEVWGGRVKSFLAKGGSDPLVIAADSVEEALAFLSQVLATAELEQHKDRVLVFDQPGVLPKLAQGTTDFIAVAHTRDVEREFGPYSSSLRKIVVYPRNATSAEPGIVLEPLGYEAFTKALEAMGKTRDEIGVLTNASGRSLTVLRRQLSNIPAIRTPGWAADHQVSSGLAQFVLVGAWDAQNVADQTALSLLAEDAPFEVLEKRILELLRLNDSPVWSIGEYRGVISKIDSLFAIAGTMTKADLNRFLDVARIVLGEDDPALDLPEADRWAAAIHGKRREFSGAVREGISETLVLLAVHGKNLFGKRLGFDGELEAARLVRDLLEPINTRKLEANERDLPLYAEAAPGEFLDIIERDLRAEKPEVLGLLRPVDTGFFGSCPRTGLLWALEGLAWNPSTFPRVVKILAQLSEVEINDNWANKPIASLDSIFRAWMPQTAVDHETRLKAIRMLLEKYPAIGWKVCLQQFGDYGNRVGDYSHKPKWRPDGYGFGEPFEIWGPIQAFVKEMVKIALTMPSYTAEMLCDLVSRLHALTSDDQERVWKIIGEWHNVGASDEDVARVREKIRVTVLSRRGRRRADEEGQASLTKKAKMVYAAMQPKDIVNKHEWLFRQGWVEESADELAENEMDFQARERRIEKLRVEALTDIVRERGVPGIFEIAEKGSSQRQIGAHVASGILGDEQVEDMILQCLRPGNDVGRNGIVAGALWTLDGDRRSAIYASLRGKITEEESLSLLLLSPYRASTWELVDQLSTEVCTRYWSEVIPQYVFDSPEENNESIRRLLIVGRPRAAFASVHFELEEVRPPLLVQMLTAMSKNGNDKSGEYRVNDYDVQRAFQLLNCNPDVSSDDKAGLEFAYLDILARSFRGQKGHHIPNLERYIEEHPEMFVQAVVWAYKRNDRGEDPPEFRVTKEHEHLGKRGYRLLEALERIPGQDKATEPEQREKLAEWVAAVRKSCAELDRAEIADLCLGKLLSNAPVGRDGVWPNEVVRDVMEDLQSEDLTNGARTGLYNSRGVHWRGEGGGQERELADKYRNWADALQFTHPFVSSSLLMSMVKTYEREAEQHDTEAGIRRRLRH